MFEIVPDRPPAPAGLGAGLREVFRNTYIVVRSMTGQTITLNVDTADTVAQLREAIQQQVDTSIAGQDLAYEGRTLLDNNTLYDHGIGRQSTVMLEMPLDLIDLLLCLRRTRYSAGPEERPRSSASHRR